MTENCGAAPRQNTIQPLESKAGEPPVVFDKQILKARNTEWMRACRSRSTGCLNTAR